MKKVTHCERCGSRELENYGESGVWWVHCHSCDHYHADNTEVLVGFLYRKKPVVFEAIQFDGKNGPEIEKWAGGDEVGWECSAGPGAEMTISMDSSTGPLKAIKGDWIIKGANGHFSPCKPDRFAEMYEIA